MDVAGSPFKHTIAKNIEKLYGQVNDELSSILKKKNPEVGPIPVNPQGKAGLMEELTLGLNETDFAQTRPDLVAKAKNFTENLLHPESVGGEAIQNTTLTNLDGARRHINQILTKWYQKGSPTVTDTDIYDAALAKINENLSNTIAEMVPEARELVNVQARLIPAYKGILGDVTASSVGVVPMGKFGVYGKIANEVLGPLQTILSREPNSAFAQRLTQLLGSEVPSQTDLLTKLPKAIKDFTKNTTKTAGRAVTKPFRLNPAILPGLETLVGATSPQPQSQ